ncbi:hypothetical protein RJ55_07202 [Drechmeria coniospora]|nr:hypothetical protein RJ55_07202 [Drechmeria coniospora]
MGVWDNNHGGKYIENPNYNPTVYGQSTCSSGGLFGGLFRGLARRADCYVEAPASYKPIKAGQGPTLDTSGANNAKEVGKPQQKSVFTNKPPQVKAGDSSADSSPQTREQAQIQPQQQEPQQQRNNQHCKHGQDCRLPGAEDPTDEPPKKQAGKMAEVAGPGGSQPSPNDGNGGQVHGKTKICNFLPFKIKKRGRGGGGKPPGGRGRGSKYGSGNIGSGGRSALSGRLAGCSSWSAMAEAALMAALSEVSKAGPKGGHALVGSPFTSGGTGNWAQPPSEGSGPELTQPGSPFVPDEVLDTLKKLHPQPSGGEPLLDKFASVVQPDDFAYARLWADSSVSLISPEKNYVVRCNYDKLRSEVDVDSCSFKPYE